MISVVIPTYNEAENLPRLVRKLEDILEVEHEFVVVDDDSPDRTWEVAEELSEEYPVKAIRRTAEKGLATAVLKGFDESEGDKIVVMDGDLQHPPEKVPELLEAVEEGADIAIGSRFVDGGSSEGFNSPFRNLVSWGANMVAKACFWDLHDIKDLQSGFFAVRKEVVEDRDFRPIGYKILLEILVMTGDIKVKEIPYTFQERTLGESNLGVDSILKYHLHVAHMFTRRHHRPLKYGAVGSSGAVVDMGLLFLLTEFFSLHYMVSAVIAKETAILTNFSLNEIWTFIDRGDEGRNNVLKRVLRFNLVSLTGVIINLALLYSLTELAGIFYLLSNAVAIMVVFAWNYFINSRWTWKK